MTVSENSGYVAASVSYRAVTERSEIPADYSWPEGVRADFYQITSLDGRTGLSVHLVPENVPESASLVISVHGSGGSIGSQPVRLLSHGLAQAGYHVLAINTRQTGEAVNTDNFYATVRDIEAAYWTARNLGYTRIVLHGHSLGTSQVSFFAATHWHSEIVGAVLTGMFADLPFKSRHLLINDEAAYSRLGNEAVRAAQDSDFSRVLAEKMSWIGGAEMAVTAEHFLTYRKVGTAGARTIDWIARIPLPLLLVRDENDSVINYFEPSQLEAALQNGISPSVTSVLLPSEGPSNGHAFEKSGNALVALVTGWLAQLHA